MRWTVVPLLMGAVVLFPGLAASDLVRPPCDVPASLSAGAVAELVLRPLVEDGILLLFLGSLAVAGAPWLVAGLAVAVFSLPEKLKNRS